MEPKTEATYPKGYKEDLAAAVAAVNQITDKAKKRQVFLRMAAAYPAQSTELKRILVPGAYDEF